MLYHPFLVNSVEKFRTDVNIDDGSDEVCEEEQGYDVSHQAVLFWVAPGEQEHREWDQRCVKQKGEEFLE